MTAEQDHTIPIPADAIIADRIRTWVSERTGQPGFDCGHDPLAGTDHVFVLAWNVMVRCGPCTMAILEERGGEPASDRCDACLAVPPGGVPSARMMKAPGTAALLVEAGESGDVTAMVPLCPPFSVIYGVCDACAAA
jgi:hypothetical protein